MNMHNDDSANDATELSETDQWWVAIVGDMLIWARLRVLPTGHAEVLDASGDILRFDDENAGRTALLDADFRAFDGLDEEDAAVLGFDLDSIEPPRADSDAELVPLLTEKIAHGHA
jgi:hypothetical protein